MLNTLQPLSKPWLPSRRLPKACPKAVVVPFVGDEKRPCEVSWDMAVSGHGTNDRGEPVEFDNNRLRFNTAGKLPII